MKTAGVLFVVFGVVLCTGAAISVLGIPLIVVGVLFSLTIVGALVGIPLILFGMLLAATASGIAFGIPMILIGAILLVMSARGQEAALTSRSTAGTRPFPGFHWRARKPKASHGQFDERPFVNLSLEISPLARQELAALQDNGFKVTVRADSAIVSRDGHIARLTSNAAIKRFADSWLGPTRDSI